ncbi:hypothetical protein FGO68_gene4039 [Halteria grandinella]|uniref:histidine kinase n=1 Tax=Halteria grandinella TaxID=5974 RepID=A0A8J8NYH5_HALGN|nr:hypothetical protein FGO68_gene4039 [Halteria grandinella]
MTFLLKLGVIYKVPIISTHTYFFHQFFLMAAIIESSIKQNPEKFCFSPVIFSFIGVQEYCNVSLDISGKEKTFQRRVLWAYFLLRNYTHYGFVDLYYLFHLAVLNIFQEKAGHTYEKYLQYIRNHNKELNEMFRSTLEMIPNGIMLFDVTSMKIRLANNEMLTILGEPSKVSQEFGDEICLKVKEFQKYGEDQKKEDGDNKKPQIMIDPISNEVTDLWAFITKICQVKIIDESDAVFKRKLNKSYIQVRCSFINNHQQLMVICTDITRVKDIERQGRRLRSSFFSSIAHELRTPLNSIIPIVKIISTLLQSPQNLERVQKLINIVKNSSMHLQNVIEDALDISRLENNKFSIYKESFDIREAVDEISEIMRFQIEQKGLKQIVYIDDSVPYMIHSDSKRIKQVLFNLIGNAVKFTFKGVISIRMTFDSHLSILTCRIQDSGIGIKENDQKKLFSFFGTLANSKEINRAGMGLGLTISKMIIQTLGGEITLKSNFGAGSEFIFTLPLEMDTTIQKTPSFNRRTSQKFDYKRYSSPLPICSNDGVGESGAVQGTCNITMMTDLSQREQNYSQIEEYNNKPPIGKIKKRSSILYEMYSRLNSREPKQKNFHRAHSLLKQQHEVREVTFEHDLNENRGIVAGKFESLSD